MKRALIYIAAAAACILAGGVLLAVTEHLSAGTGVYCGLGTATTVGCSPGIPVAARIVSAALMLTAIPLFALAYGSLSNAHLRKHMGLHMKATVAQVRNELEFTLQRLTEEADKRHVILRGALDKHARDLLDRADAHHAALIAHVSSATARPEPPGPTAQAAIDRLTTMKTDPHTVTIESGKTVEEPPAGPVPPAVPRNSRAPKGTRA